jgi:hypothetical protein
VFGAVQVLVKVGTGPAGRLRHGDGVEVDATLQEGELLSRYEHVAWWFRHHIQPSASHTASIELIRWKTRGRVACRARQCRGRHVLHHSHVSRRSIER